MSKQQDVPQTSQRDILTDGWLQFIVSAYLRYNTHSKWLSGKIDYIPSILVTIIIMFTFSADASKPKKTSTKKQQFTTQTKSINHTPQDWSKDIPRSVKRIVYMDWPWESKNFLSSFKSEICYFNSPFLIRHPEWDDAVEKARARFPYSTITAKRRPPWNEIYRIKPGEPIPLYLVIVMVLYSQVPSVQQALMICDKQLKEQYSRKKQKSVTDFKRHLMAVVNLFGDEMGDQTLYHGCPDGDITLDTVNNAILYHPISASLSWVIATEYAEKFGTVLHLTRGDAKGALYFDFSVFSEIAEQKRLCLVYGGPVNVELIKCVKPANKKEYSFSSSNTYVFTDHLGFMEKLINGSFWVNANGKSLKPDKDFMRKVNLLLNNYVCERTTAMLNDKRADISHKQKIFNNMMNERDIIFLNELYFKNGCKEFEYLLGHKANTIFLKYNYQYYALPVFRWKISEEEMKRLHGFLLWKKFECDIGYLIKDYTVIFGIYLDYSGWAFNSGDAPNMEIKVECMDLVSNGGRNIEQIDFEYELYIEQISYYRYFSIINSKDKHHYTLPSKDLSLEFVIRVINCSFH